MDHALVLEKRFGRFVLLPVLSLLSLAFALDAFGQNRAVYNDYDTQMKGSEHIGSLGPGFFGDHTDFYTGATTFLVTDVSLPGNSDLTVALQRSLAAYDDGVNRPPPYPSWTNFEVPYLSGIYKSLSSHDDDEGWQTSYSGGTTLQRCSIPSTGPEVTQSSGKLGEWTSQDYWRGIHLYRPGGQQEPLAILWSSDPSHPTDGGTYYWATKNHWHFSCLPTTKNAAGGEGFLGIAPDGTRYWFDWLVEWRTAETLEKEELFGDGITELDRTEYRMLVTRIEDRFGNWVSYTYSGKNLVGISANDGRQLTMTYTTTQPIRISSVSDGTRTWTYSYTDGVEVTFPDSTTWHATASGPGIQRHDPIDCSSENARYSGSYNITIQHRTGAVGNFSFAPLRRGISHADWRQIDYCPKAPRYIDNIALQAKSLSGPELANSTWSITYGPANGCYAEHDPECTTSSPTTRFVDVNGPDSTFVRYTFGNKYRDSDGMLTRIRTGTSISNVLRDEQFTWETILAPGYGTGGGYLSGIKRLEKTRTTVQQGTTYNKTNSDWDAFHNPQTVQESGPNGGSRTTQYTYYNNKSIWVVGQIASETSPGMSISRTFNSSGSVASVSRSGVTTSYTYHADGNLATVTYPRSLVHSFSTYKLGLPRSESQPDGVQITRVVNDHGYLVSETNGEGHTTGYAYDVMGRVSAIDYPRGHDATVVHTPLRTTITRGPLVETTDFDGLRRPIRSEVGGIATEYAYDAYSRRTFESNPGASIGTHYEHDVLGRTTKITNPDGSYRTFQYPGATLVVRDERANETTYTYRAYGNPERKALIGIAAPVPAASVSIGRLPNDLVSSVTQGGFTRTFTYDTRNYLKTEAHPELGTITYVRDAAGNVTSRTIGGAQTTYGYDGHNREVSTAYPDSTPSVAKTYSKTGKLESVSTSVASRVLAYDANDNLTQESLTTGGQVLAADYSYNGNDQLATITYPVSGTVITYTPDALGRPTEVSGYVTSVTYWPSGLPHEITYANGIITEYEQNSRLWPSAFRVRKSSAYYLSSDYLYDPAGNLTAIDDSVEPGMNRTLGYDAINRLTGANGSWGTGTIAYDGAGNITNQSLGSFLLNYSYDGQNRLTGISGSQAKTYGYDLRGNIAASGGKSFVYDAVPNLVCANCGAADEVTYAYDGLQKRVEVTKIGTMTYEFHSVNGDLLVTYAPSDAGKVTEYFYLAGKRIAQRIIDDNPSTSITPVATTLLADQSGSVTIAVDIGGTSPGGTVAFLKQGASLGSSFVTGGTASIEVSGLAATSHSITARYSGDESNSGSSLSYEVQVIDRKPPSISVPVSSSTGTYTISWGTASAPVSSYELYEATNASFSGATKVYDGTELSTQLSGRGNGSYYYRVRGCDTSGCSGYRAGTNAIEVLLPPDIPSSISVPSSSTTGDYTISWGSANGVVTSYKLYEATTSSFSAQTLVHDGAAMSKALVDRGNGTFYYRVRACNSSGCSNYRIGSNPVNVTLPPGAPASISVPTNSTTGSATISWGTASGVVTSYRLYQAGSSSFSGQTLVYSGSAISKALSGLTNGTYYYRVRACNGSACGSYRTGSNALSVTLPPGAPSSINIPSTSATGNFTISWGTATGNVTAYKLYQSTNSSFSGQVLVHNGTATSKALSGRGNGTYYFRVRACNGSACGAYRTAGNNLTVSILQGSVSDTEWSWFRIGQATSVSPNIVVTATGGFGTYSYQWQRVSGDTQTSATNPSSRSTGWSHPVPSNFVTYTSYWRCRVTDGSGNVTYTPNVKVTFRKEYFM